MKNKKTVSFLEAEEAANRLLQSLEELNRETGAHRSSSESLDHALSTLQSALKSLDEVTTGLKNLVNLVRRTASEDFFDRLQHLDQQVNQFRMSLTDSVQSLQSTSQELKRDIRVEREQEIAHLLDELNQWKEDVFSQTRKLNQENALVFRQSVHSITREIHSQQKITSTTRTIALLGVLLGIAAVITAILWR